jgi:hypothetical protein
MRLIDRCCKLGADAACYYFHAWRDSDTAGVARPVVNSDMRPCCCVNVRAPEDLCGHMGGGA